MNGEQYIEVMDCCGYLFADGTCCGMGITRHVPLAKPATCEKCFLGVVNHAQTPNGQSPEYCQCAEGQKWRAA